MSDGCVTVDRSPPAESLGPNEGSGDQTDRLRKLAETGPSVSAPARDQSHAIDPHRLDEKTAALACLAALVAVRATPSSYRRWVDLALAAGATVDDVVDTLTVVAPSVGLARVVSAAPGLALAVGYDIDAALETFDDP